MKIQSTKRMKVQSFQMKNQLGQPSSTPGLLIGIEEPPAALAEAAKEIHKLPRLPNSVLLGVPAPLGAKTPLAFTPVEKALITTGASVLKMVSEEIASASGVPVVKHGVKMFWFGVNIWKLHEKWSDADRDVPALIVETAATGLESIELLSDFYPPGARLLGSDLLNENTEVVLSVADAMTNNKDVSLALLSQKFGSTDAGKALGLLAPLLEAALSSDPACAGIQFRPLPYA